MGLSRIQNNVAAFNAHRNLQVSGNQVMKSLERLSSGFRINRAGDDASGLVISEQLRSQIGGLKQATRNAQDGISVVQTAEGALTEVHSMLQRMRDLAVQANSTGVYDATAIAAAQDEYDELAEEVTRITGSTKFGSLGLLDGSFADNAVAGVTAVATVAAVAEVAESTDDIAAKGYDFSTGAGVTFTIGDGTATATFASNADLVSEGGFLSAVQSALDTAGLDYTASVDGTSGALVLTADVAEDRADLTITDVAGTYTGGGATTTQGVDAVAGVTGVTASDNTAGIFQVGANAGETLTINIDSMDSTTLAVDGLTVSDSATITALDAAIGTVSGVRGELGAKQNRFEHTVANLQVATENLIASESRIRDTDMAAEMTAFTRAQILQQAGTAMLAQANLAPQSVLGLLQ